MKVFSINALAELLEKDRQTIVRALRGTPADATEKRQPRWRMATAVAALERHNRASKGNSGGDGQDPLLKSLFEKFDKEYNSMRALKTLDARRKASLALGPLIGEIDTVMRAHGRDMGAGDELSDLRADKLFLLCMRGFERPCQWSFDEVRLNLNI